MDIQKIADKYGVTRELVEELLTKLRRTGGRQLQFSDDALGGMGQWSAGMVMISRMDDALKARVNAFCTELAESVRSESPGEASGTIPEQRDAPPDVTPSATAMGSQNGVHYAYFAESNRLVVKRDGIETTYDATGHAIRGVAQDQSSGDPGTLRFTTARGEIVNLDALKQIP